MTVAALLLIFGGYFFAIGCMNAKLADELDNHADEG